MEKTKIAKTTRDALAKGNFYQYDPDQLVIITDPKHPLFDPRGLEAPDAALVQSMLNFGFKTSSSVEVEATKEGLVVVDGRRRVIAAREVKRIQHEKGEDVSIRVRCLVSKDKPFVGMILGNAHRKDESVLQKAAKAKRSIDMGYSEIETANLFGVTTQTIKNWLAAEALPDLIKAALETNNITVTLALELAKKTPEEQLQVLAGAKTLPIKGAQGRERVSKPQDGETSKRLSAGQVRKFREAFKEHPKSVNSELAMALLDFILGDNPSASRLADFEPVKEIALSIKK